LFITRATHRHKNQRDKHKRFSRIILKTERGASKTTIGYFNEFKPLPPCDLREQLSTIETDSQEEFIFQAHSQQRPAPLATKKPATQMIGFF
jgi:hypothetical protein